MRPSALALFLLLSGCGEDDQVREEPILSQEEVRKHNAPHPDAVCPREGADWPSELSISLPEGTDLARTSPKAAIDGCNNLVVAWADDIRTSVLRILGDGSFDWSETLLHTGDAWHGPTSGIGLDRYGSIFVANQKAIVSLTAAGNRHPSAPEDLAIRTSFIRADKGGFLVGLPGYAKLALPSGMRIWQSSDFNILWAADQWTVSGQPLTETQFLRIELLGPASALGDVRETSLSFPEDSTLRAIRETLWREERSELPAIGETSFEHSFRGYLTSLSSGSLGAQAAVAYSLSPEEASDTPCESWLRWESTGKSARLDSCMWAQDVAFSKDGSLHSLWVEAGSESNYRLRLLRWAPEASTPSEVNVEQYGPTGEPAVDTRFFRRSLASFAFGHRGELFILGASADSETLRIAVVKGL